MEELKFDKKLFNKGYGIPYRIAQVITGINFWLLVIALLLVSFFSINIFDILWWKIYEPVLICIVLSAVGYPIAIAIKIGMRRLVVASKVRIEQGRICYDRAKEILAPKLGGIVEYYYYTIENVTSVKKARRYYYVTGDVHLVIINNGRRYKEKKLTEVKIPNAYSGMEKMMSIGKE